MRFIVSLAILVASAPVAGAQAFVVDNSLIPADASPTENVDFGDVDLDGDWDVALADGGDDGNDQNRLWINQGGAQGGQLGFFEDETGTQFPALVDDSRDIEFADIDNDGDLDVNVSNTAQISNQGNRWWVNQGGKQGGTIGFYADETDGRWIGLGVAPSSVAPGLLIGGTFKDWSCDSDFGDLDNDGDLDLVHSSYGGAFGGQTPTRIFLNDGDGHFSEFNPSGFMLPLDKISAGDPGLWCEGTQQTDTTSTDGTFCDVASSPLDIDVGDTDGDFDLDILHGARQEVPRFFANRLVGSPLAPEMGGGQLGFRDVSALVFPPGYASGSGHYEQEMGDLDGDGDLDILGVNWQIVLFSFDDTVFENTGVGTFVQATTLVGSPSDDNEGDFLDYDNDGDLDVMIANWSGQDYLFRNDTGFSFTSVPMPTYSSISLDIDCCDTDGDGDYDALVAENNFQSNTFLKNVTGVPDTHAPVLPNLETVNVAVAQSGRIPVRAHVYDNAPYYITWYNPTELVLQVDGKLLPFTPMRSSGGQVFRGEIPAHLVGNVLYRVRSTDEYGNMGNSEIKTYAATGDTGTLYGSSTGGVTISAQSEARAGMELYLSGSNAPAGAVGFLGIALAPEIPPFVDPGIPGLVLNVASVPPNPVFLASGQASVFGHLTVKTPKIPPGAAGIDIYCQYVSVSGTGGDVVESSQGLHMTVKP